MLDKIGSNILQKRPSTYYRPRFRGPEGKARHLTSIAKSEKIPIIRIGRMDVNDEYEVNRIIKKMEKLKRSHNFYELTMGTSDFLIIYAVPKDIPAGGLLKRFLEEYTVTITPKEVRD
jgi:hypothetical protein